MEAIYEQLELMCTRPTSRHNSSQRSVLQGMAATTIQRAWRRRGVRVAFQHVPATKLVKSTSQVVRGCVSFFKSCAQQATKVLTLARDAPAFAVGAVVTMRHLLGASLQQQQDHRARHQAVIALQARVRRRNTILAKTRQNCSSKGWKHCVPLTNRVIQGYTLAQRVTCSRQAAILQPPCEPVAGVSIFAKAQAPATNGGWRSLGYSGDTTDQSPAAQRFRTVNGSLASLHTAYDPQTMQYDPKKMPSQHRGFIRLSDADKWLSVKILVDTGSQQPNLIATRCAQKIRCQLQQATQGAASQAGGVILTTEEVQDLQLAINGTAVTQPFFMADIADYDIILGERWCLEHQAVIDYADESLYAKTAQGFLLRLDLTEEPAERKSSKPSLRKRWNDDVVAFSGVLQGTTKNTWGGHQTANYLHSLQDFHKDLPEDADMGEQDIPGLVVPEKGTISSFQTVVSQVSRQLTDRSVSPADIQEILDKFAPFEKDVFETRVMPRVAPERDMDLTINEKPGSTPQCKAPYRVGLHHIDELRRQVGVLLEAGIIRTSTSEYAAPCLFTPKPHTFPVQLRLCVDYRALNSQMLRDRYPTPTAGDLIAATRGGKLFSKIDLHSGFHQLKIRASDCHKTAFTTPFGLYEFVSAPFGLANTPGCFQRFMNHVLRRQIAAGTVVVYCDDVCIFTKTTCPLEHMAAVEEVLAALREHQLLAKGSKCQFFCDQMDFLGFVVSADGVSPQMSKVEAIRQLVAPSTVGELRSFLGCTNFFASHIPGYSHRAACLTEMLKGTKGKGQKLQWNLQAQAAFEDLRGSLTEEPCLRHFDPLLRTAVHVDASQQAVGAVLLQWADNNPETRPRPVCFLSKKLQGAQYRYDARSVEALAVQMALSTWRTYLYGLKFEVHSDHRSLQFLFSQNNPSQRILRLCDFMSQFDFEEVKFVRGSEAAVPDLLSRPMGTTGRVAGAAGEDSGQTDSTVGHLHVLGQCQAKRTTSFRKRQAEAPHSTPCMLLPRCGSKLAVLVPTTVDGKYALLGGSSTQNDPSVWPAGAWARLLLPVPTAVTYRGQRHGVHLWEGQVADVAAFEVPALAWVELCDLPPQRAAWTADAFSMLTAFDLFQDDQQGSMCTLPSTDTAVHTDLTRMLAAQVTTDVFLSKVLEQVKASETGRWRGFYIAPNHTVCHLVEGAKKARICVPTGCRGAVMMEAHGGSVLVGHPGMARTLASVADSYYWPTMAADVDAFVRSCRVCAGAKTSTHLRMGVETFSAVPVTPFSHWAMDLISMPMSRGGNDLIATWVDRTSKTIVARALKESASTSQDLARLTFESVCCRFGIPERLTHDNDVRFKTMWQELWRVIGTKLVFTSSYNPHSDPAERANKQILEALRAAVTTVARYDEWDTALPYICFGLNTHMSQATGTSPFELVHGFRARVPLEVGAETLATQHDPHALDLAMGFQNRLRAAADHNLAAQVRLGITLAARSVPAEVKVGDMVWMDGAHVPHQVPWKLAPRWFGPYRVREVKGAACTLDLPETLGKTSDKVNVRRLKFFEERDADFGDCQGPVQPTLDPLGVRRYEIKRIVAHRVFHRRPEYWVQWEGYDAAWDMWVHRDVLVEDVPDMLVAYHRLGGLPMQPRRGAPKRASVGRLLLPGEVAFPDVRLGVVGDSPVRVKRSSIPAQLSASRVVLSRCGMSQTQVHDRAARAGRRGGL